MIEFDDCVLRREQLNFTNFRDWMRSLDNERSRVESVINHQHIYDIRQEGWESERAEDLAPVLAAVMQRTWRCALQAAFPKRHFDVTVWAYDDGSDPEVSFFQPEHADAAGDTSPHTNDDADSAVVDVRPNPDQLRIDESTVTEFLSWRSDWPNPDMDISWYIVVTGSVGVMAAVAALLWPTFSVLDGTVQLAHLRHSGDTDNEPRNSVNLRRCFAHGHEYDGAMDVLHIIGRMLRHTWSAALREAYPDRMFVVSYDSDEQYGDPTITFWQVRDESASVS